MDLLCANIYLGRHSICWLMKQSIQHIANSQLTGELNSFETLTVDSTFASKLGKLYRWRERPRLSGYWLMNLLPTGPLVDNVG